MFGVSKTDTDKLWAGISNTSTSEGPLKTTEEYQLLKPVLSVISEKTLSCSMSVNSHKNQYVQRRISFRLFVLMTRAITNTWIT